MTSLLSSLHHAMRAEIAALISISGVKDKWLSSDYVTEIT